VIAEDADVVDDKKLKYTFVDAEPKDALELFTIEDDVDTNSGRITVGKSLIDKWGVYRLTVMVSIGFEREAYANLCAFILSFQLVFGRFRFESWTGHQKTDKGVP
jgi:hypothetical protein